MDPGSVAASVLRAVPAATPRTGGERVALSLRLVAQLLDGALRAGGVAPELARELRTLAGDDGEAFLVLPAGPGPARIEIGPRQLPLPAPLAAALFAAHRSANAHAHAPAQGAAAASSPTAAGASINTALVATTAHAWAVGAQANAAALAVASGQPQQAAMRSNSPRSDSALTRWETRWDAPLHDARSPPGLKPAGAGPGVKPAGAGPGLKPAGAGLDAGQTAARLRATVELSGLFFESHAAQWAHGQRSDEALRAELVARSEAASPAQVNDKARTAAQLDVMQRQSIFLAGPAWPGQPVTIELVPERHADDTVFASAGAQRVAAATLHLELPNLGAIVVRLRLAGDAVAAEFESSRTPLVESALPEFDAALQARGLRPVHLSAMDRT